MQILPGDLRVGSIVRVRGGRWRILDIRAYERSRLVTLSGLSPPNLHATRRVITPFDILEPVDGRRSRPRVVGARAWRNAFRQVLSADMPPGRLRTAAAAGIDLLPHQLEPAMAVVQGRAARILLADEVGLGKTIQAGLVITELIARRAIDRVLILTPAGLRDQWREELRRRFAVTATLVDAQSIAARSAQLPRDINPWTTIPVAIASIELVKRLEVLRAVSAARWDLVVVDEAHAAATAADRHAAASVLCGGASYVVTITATPHSGDTRAFESLCQLGSAGDPQIIFRRTRSDVGFASRRRVHIVRVRRSGDEGKMDAALVTYANAVRREHGDGALALSVLQKRGLSSAWSLAESVDRRLQSLTTGDSDNPAQILLPLVDADGDFSPDDLPPCWPPDLALADPVLERRLLTDLAAAARRASVRESKIAALARLLRRVGERVIVFTEYRDTLTHLYRAVGARGIVLHGGMARDERAAALARFAAQPHAVLLATDAAGEGLNLQDGCRFVINLELPWNPMRLEQRIGRVDRIGQRRTVHTCHLVARGEAEEAILIRLRRRLAAAGAAIDVPDPLGLETPATDIRRSDPIDAVAIDEAVRVATLRRLGVSADRSAPDSRVPVLFSRRSRTRLAIGSDVLTVWRVVAEDAAGASVAGRVVPVVLRGVQASDRHRGRLQSLLDALTPSIQARVADTTAHWRDEAARIDAAFRSTRVDRERSISGRNQELATTAYQAGLFDRRADRTRAAAAARDLERVVSSTERLARCEEPIARWSIELALVALAR